MSLPPGSRLGPYEIMGDVFDVSHDGQRFVVVMGSAQTLTSPFTVVVNWMADLKR